MAIRSTSSSEIFLLPPVVELGGPWRLVVGDVLGRLERAAVLQVGGDAGGAEGMVPDPGLDAGGLRPALDHAVGVLLPQSVAGEPARSARRGLEQGCVRVLRDAGRGDIFVQIPLQVVVAGDFMLLAAFFVQPHPAAAPLHEVVADFHLQHGVDAGEGVDHGPDQGEIAQADKGRFLYRSVFALCCADRLDALEQLARADGRGSRASCLF